MPNKYTLTATQRLILLLISLLFIKNNEVLAQSSEGCYFMQGNYIEVGIAPNGAFGTPANAPAGYHPRPTPVLASLYNPVNGTYTQRFSAVGFVADYGKDGWDVGTPPYFGDYFMPATVQEGFAIQVAGLRGYAYSNNYQFSGSSGFTGPLTGSNVSLTTGATSKQAVWEGNMNQLFVRQTITLKNTKSYFTGDIVLKNKGTDTLKKIYYMRTLDPDNDVSSGGSFTTMNKIAYQLPNAGNKTLVTATGTFYRNAYLGLGTKDCQAKCYVVQVGLFPTGDLQNIYDGTAGGYQYVDSLRGDVAIGLLFKVGDLAPGDSTTFSYAYILNESDLDEAFSETDQSFRYNGNVYPSGAILVKPVGTVLPIDIVNGGSYTWNWTPATNLDIATGPHVNATVSPGPITYSVKGVGLSDVPASCRLRDLTLTISPLFTSPPPEVQSPIYYCLNQPATTLTAIGPGIMRWYTSPSGGTALATAPIPSTAAVGVFTWYVTQETIGMGVESVRIPVEVHVLPLPKPDLGSDRSVCSNSESLRLDAGSYKSYLWQDNSTGRAFTVNAVGTYWVEVKDSAGCKGVDSVNVLKIFPLPAGFLPGDTAICRGNTIRLTVPGFTSYLWSTGATGISVNLSVFDQYWLRVKDNNGCYGTDSIILSDGHCLPFMIPNAFTPNKDGKNEFFMPLNMGDLASYHMEIWNRWGQRVFISNDPRMGWDGTSNGRPQSSGTYVYVIRYALLTNGFMEQVQGTVNLIQ